LKDARVKLADVSCEGGFEAAVAPGKKEEAGFPLSRE
jgi:hypothetical protein